MQRTKSITFWFAFALVAWSCETGAYQDAEASSFGRPNNQDAEASSFGRPNIDFPPPDGEAVAKGDWARAAAAAECSRLERCRDAGLYLGHYGGEPCEQFFSRTFEARYPLEERSEQGGVAFDGEVFGRCLVEHAALDCFAGPLDRVPCVHLLGTRGLGDACDADADCGVEGYCEDICLARVAAGGSCDGGDICTEGLVCGDTHCRAVPGPGEDCDGLCSPGYQCDLRSDSDFNSWCVPRSVETFSEGEICRLFDGLDKCEGDSRCRSHPTYKNAFCSVGGALGEDCQGPVDARLGSCGAGLYCEGPVESLRGECAAQRPLGETCSGARPGECVLGATCSVESQTCVPASRARGGEACAQGDECYSEVCDLEAGVCYR